MGKTFLVNQPCQVKMGSCACWKKYYWPHFLTVKASQCHLDFLVCHFLILVNKKCFIPMKISHKLCDRMDGTQFWCFPWFPTNSLLCVILRYTVYVCEKCVLKRRHKMLQQFCMWICSLKPCFYADVHWKLKVWVQGFRKRGCQGCHWHPQRWHPQEDEFILFQIGRTEFAHPLLLAPPTIFTFRHPWIDLDRNPSICFCLSS